MNISSVSSSVFNNVSETFGWLASKPNNKSDVLKRIAVLAVLIIGSAAVFAGLTFSGGLPFIAIPVIAVASSLIVSLFLGSYLRPGNDDSGSEGDDGEVVFEPKGDGSRCLFLDDDDDDDDGTPLLTRWKIYSVDNDKASADADTTTEK